MSDENDKDNTISWEDILKVQKIMDEQAIPEQRVILYDGKVYRDGVVIDTYDFP